MKSRLRELHAPQTDALQVIGSAGRPNLDQLAPGRKADEGRIGPTHDQHLHGRNHLDGQQRCLFLFRLPLLHLFVGHVQRPLESHIGRNGHSRPDPSCPLKEGKGSGKGLGHRRWGLRQPQLDRVVDGVGLP